jgi:hypothetical protein
MSSADGDLVRRDLELGPQMKIRKELLAFLMAFINENGALTKVSAFPLACLSRLISSVADVAAQPAATAG